VSQCNGFGDITARSDAAGSGGLLAGEHDTLAIKSGRFVLADLLVEPGRRPDARSKVRVASRTIVG
jgi:hypothetical protein